MTTASQIAATRRMRLPFRGIEDDVAIKYDERGWLYTIYDENRLLRGTKDLKEIEEDDLKWASIFGHASLSYPSEACNHLRRFHEELADGTLLPDEANRALAELLTWIDATTKARPNSAPFKR